MTREYSAQEMIDLLVEHYQCRGYTCECYAPRLGEIRLPLYCFKTECGELQEMAIDIITESLVSKQMYLPDTRFQGATVKNASPVKFFQHYLPWAKVYWAYADYVRKDAAFTEFAGACEEDGIGLLEVTKDGVKETLAATSLMEGLFSKVSTLVHSRKTRDGIDKRIRSLIKMHQEESNHYLVIYGAPLYRMRAVTNRAQQDLSMILINKLQGIGKLKYADILQELARTYRVLDKSDYEIAQTTIHRLWRDRLGVDYPPLHRDLEPVLLLNPDYRDHYLHQFQVFLLGAVIVDRLYETKPIRDFMTHYGCDFEDAWLAASTYHDFDYPLQDCEVWMGKLVADILHIRVDNPIRIDLEGVIIRDEFLRKMQGLCEAIGCQLDDCFLRFVLGRAAFSKNHAVLGALSLLNCLEGKGGLTPSALNCAAASILMHDSKNWECFCGRRTSGFVWEKAFSERKTLPLLPFADFPLFFLLAFCDVAQEWGRVGRYYDSAKAKLENIRIDDGNGEVYLHISVEDEEAWQAKQAEIGGLKHFLQDDRFKILVQNPEGGTSAEFIMTGT